MPLTLRVYKDNGGFYSAGIYRSFFYENLELMFYETISFVSGVYSGGVSVTMGEVLTTGDPRGKLLLKIRNTLTGEYAWVQETKEQIVALGKTDSAMVTVNNYIGCGSGSGSSSSDSIPLEFYAADDQNSTHIVGIGRARISAVQKGSDLIGEYKKGAAFSAGDLPVGKNYKVDPTTDLIYWGQILGIGERVYIESDKNLPQP